MAANGVVAHRWVPETKSVEGFSYDVSKPDGSKEDVHVLAVDDSHVDRKVIERLLKISSCKVTSVDSGRRALQFLGLLDGGGEKSSSFGSKVDLIITDYCMPGMTGYELLKTLKESSTFKEVPVVIMSSENVVARIDRCLEEGAEEFLVKPVKLSDVKRLRDYMTTTREVKVGHNQQSSEAKINSHNINKRKLRESISDVAPSSTSSQPLISPSSSPSKFQPPVTCASPSSLDSPIRRLKLTRSEKLEID